MQTSSAEHEMENLADTDLFFIDDGAASSAPPAEEPDEQPYEGSDADELHNSNERNTTSTTKRKHLAWSDPDDTDLQVSLTSNKRLRKLRDAASEDTVGGREYERRLRRQFQKINPAPEWASKARQQLHGVKAKRTRPSSSSASDSESEPDALPELTAATDGIIRKTRKSSVLPRGTISIERLRDANLSAKAEGEITTVQFHPSPQVPLLLTASADRRLRLFNVDGHTNPHLQTLHLPDLKLTNAVFHPDGTSILLTGPRPFYYRYDLQSGTTQRSPRGLWGTTFARADAAAQDASMETCAFDPSGEILAVAGRRGYVHLVDWRAGAGQVVGSVKSNSAVKSLWWAGSDLVTLGEDSEVYIWDIAERKCVRRWKDDGGFGSQILSGDKAGRYLAIGSRTGIVNVYGADAVSSSHVDRPKPLKTIGNLTTSITSMRFNHDSQILAMSSSTKKDQMRMIHMPSLTAFSNWPTSSTPLGHVTSLDFSPESQYLAMGNNRGRVLLYHLRDYAQQ